MLSRSVKAGVLAFGKLIASLSGMFCFAALTRLLDETEYATYRQALLVYMTTAPVLVMGLSQALYYFLPREPERGRALVLENMLPLLATGALFFLFLVAGGNQLIASAYNNDQLAVVLLVFAPYALAVLPLSSFEASLVINNRVRDVTIFTILSRLLFVALVVGAAWWWQAALPAVAGAVIASALVLPIGLWLLFRAVPEGGWRPDWSSVRRQFIYAIPLGLATMVSGLAQQVDKTIVAVMSNPETFAVFANGATELYFIGILTGSVTAVLLPDATRALKAGNQDEALRLWKSAAAKTALIVMPVFFSLLVFAAFFIEIVFSKKYPDSVVPFRIYLFILPLRIVVFSALLMAANRTRWVLWGSIGMLVSNLILSIPFVYWLGPNGAAVATIVTFYGWIVPFYLIGIRQVVDTTWAEILPWPAFLRTTTVCLVPTLVCYVVLKLGWLPGNPFFGLPIGMAVFGGILLALYWSFGFVHPRDIFAHASQLWTKEPRT